MTISSYIEYFDKLLNINTSNEIVYQDIIDELNKIAKVGDIAEFKEFAKSNLKSLDVQYLTGFQKFIRLSKLFKDKTLSHIGAGSNTKARDLRLKLQLAFNQNTKEELLNDKFQFKCIKTDGKNYFSDKELYILEKLDKQKVFNWLDDSYLLELYILEEYKKQTNIHKQIKLSGKVEQIDNKVLGGYKNEIDIGDRVIKQILIKKRVK